MSMPELWILGSDEIFPPLMAAIKAERRGTLVFSVATILLTPFFILAVLALLLMGLAFIAVQGGLLASPADSRPWLIFTTTSR